MITEAIDPVVLCFGDQQITGVGCVVESFNIDVNNNILPVAYCNGKIDHIIQGNKECRIELTLLCRDINMLFDKNINAKKLRNKKIEDASINELLFAVRQKVKKK